MARKKSLKRIPAVGFPPREKSSPLLVPPGYHFLEAEDFLRYLAFSVEYRKDYEEFDRLRRRPNGHLAFASFFHKWPELVQPLSPDEIREVFSLDPNGAEGAWRRSALKNRLSGKVAVQGPGVDEEDFDFECTEIDGVRHLRTTKQPVQTRVQTPGGEACFYDKNIVKGKYLQAQIDLSESWDKLSLVLEAIIKAARKRITADTRKKKALPNDFWEIVTAAKELRTSEPAAIMERLDPKERKPYGETGELSAEGWRLYNRKAATRRKHIEDVLRKAKSLGISF